MTHITTMYNNLNIRKAHIFGGYKKFVDHNTPDHTPRTQCPVHI